MRAAEASLLRVLLVLLGIVWNMPVGAQTWPPLLPESRPGVRWWWMGSAVDDENLRWSLQEYAQAGIGAVEITPIYGVQGNESRELSFLSAPWMRVLQTVENEAARQGVLVEMNTGTGWPFGGPDTPLSEAACKAVFVVDTVAVGKPSLKSLPPREQGLARFLGECRRRLPTLGSTASASEEPRELVVQLYESRTRQQVKRAAPGGQGLVIDHFDRDAVRHYLDRFDHAFERTATPFPHVFFNDSYEVYAANWTPSLPDEFRHRRGYDLLDRLPELLGLVDDGNQVLSDYRETLSDLLLQNFSEQWTRWAHGHGVLTRNQAHGSPANLIDVYASVDIPEIEGFGLSDFGISGLRTDSGMTRQNFSDVSMLKYASSAAHITGKPFTSSETFTWLTEHFRTSLSQMKPDLDLMFSCGVNHMFFHGTCYSPRSDRWPGWKFYASVDMSPTNSIWHDAPFLMMYITRCQQFLQWGKPDNDFLVYLPVRDMWHQRLEPGAGGLLMQFDIHTMDRKAPDFIRSIRQLDSLGYDCDYISDRYLLTTTLTDGQLTTAAGTRYRGLVIPGSGVLPPSLRAHIDSLQVQGAHIVWGIDPVRLRQAARPEPLRTQMGLRVLRRSNPEGHHYFVANLTPRDVSGRVPLAVACRRALWFNPLDGSTAPADITADGLRCSLRSGESRILQVWTEDNSAPADTDVASAMAETTLATDTGDGVCEEIELTGPWKLSFVTSEPRVQKHFRLRRLQTWEQLPDDSARVTMGTGAYETTFRLTSAQARGQWQLELGDVRESARVFLNGTFVGCVWSVPFVVDCGRALRAGRNHVRIEVTNLPANRIAHLDRQGYPWRKFNEINMVDLNYRATTYAHWAPVPSGLNAPVRLVGRRAAAVGKGGAGH